MMPHRRPPSSTLFPDTTLFRSDNRDSIGFRAGHIASWQNSPAWVPSAERDDRPRCSAPVVSQGPEAKMKVGLDPRSEEHTSELQHVEKSYAVFCLKKKTQTREQ